MSTMNIAIKGRDPGLLMHAWQPAALLTQVEEDERLTIIGKTESKRSEEEKQALAAYDCLRALYIGRDGQPTIPTSAVRAAIEAGARKTKEGPTVRELMLVDETNFVFDRQELGDTPQEWRMTLQHHAGVKNKGSGGRVNRVRALFPTWSLSARLTIEDLDSGKPMIDVRQMTSWLTTAGRRIGIGDWRPQTGGGVHGRFDVVSVDWA